VNAGVAAALPFFFFTITAFAIGAVGMYAGSRRADASVRRNRWIKFATYFVIMNGTLAVIAIGRTSFTLLALVIAVIGSFELHRLHYPSPVVRAIVGVAFWVCAAGTALFAFIVSGEWAMFVFLVVALFDGFSQVAGQLAGRHPLARRISPTKTIEGTVGGALASALGAWVLSGAAHLAPLRAVGLTLVIIPAALFGDLSASWIKRSTGVKDFGELLPGHGGVLDRFDSFLVAAPMSLIALLAR
jgi:phosphatidate cytidylyltransferase